jgi:hypothetical protein
MLKKQPWKYRYWVVFAKKTVVHKCCGLAHLIHGGTYRANKILTFLILEALKIVI